MKWQSRKGEKIKKEIYKDRDKKLRLCDREIGKDQDR